MRVAVEVACAFACVRVCVCACVCVCVCVWFELKENTTETKLRKMRCEM